MAYWMRPIFAGAALGVFGVCLVILLAPVGVFATDRLPDLLASEKSLHRESPVDPRLEETMDRAQSDLEAGRIQSSSDQFAVVAKLADEPLKSRATLKYGLAATMLDRPDARPALTAASQTAIDDPEGGEIRAMAWRMLEQTAGRTILTAPPKESSGWMGRRSRPAGPNFWEQIRDIETLRQKGRITTAVRLYREILADYPEHPVILNNLALLLCDGIDPKEAESLVRRAMNATGAEQYVEYLFDTLGVALLGQGHAADALEHFRRSIAMRETPDRNRHMALALETLGQPDVAAQYRDRASVLGAAGDWRTE